MTTNVRASADAAPSAAYPLSPIQEGMLFHWLRDRHSGTDIEQIVAELHEPVDPARLESSWQRTVDDFATLRTAFLWDERESPAQHIVAAASLPFSVHDLRGVPQSDRAVWMHQFIRDDRRDGFDLSAAPAMRVSLLQLDDEEFCMVWTFHHILIDGRSFETILDRVFSAYDDDAWDGDRAPVERAYREYPEWVATQDGRAAREFWRDKLSGFTATTPLPHADQIEPSTEPFAEARISLSRPVSDGLGALAAREQLSLNSLVIAAWALLLARHSGEPEVVFGVTKTTRRGTIPDADAIVGLFLATIPVRVAVDSEATIVEWLRRVREEWVSLRGREHVPLVDIKQASALPASASLFDSFLMFENYELGERLRSKGGAWARRSVTLLEQPGYPLALMAYGGDTLSLKLDYDTRRFDRESVGRLLAQLATMLGAWSSSTEGRVWQVPMLSESERRRILHDWNRTEKTYAREKSLAALIEDQVLVGPSRVAITFEDENLTYAEMNERANRLANELIRRGVGPDSLVGVCLDRTPDLLVALVAVVKSGGAYVPLDPGFPRDRLLYMAEDAKLRAVVTEPPFDRLFAGSQADVVLVDVSRSSDAPAANPSVGVAPEHLAYVLYTSGSTGHPKGVEVTRGGFLNLVWSMRDLPGMTAEDSIVALTTVSFDIAGVETLLPLALGARIILATRETALNPEALRTLIERTSPTIVQATPVTFKMLFEAGWRGDGKVKTICGGEPISVELGASLSAACGEAWNGYGPTETTVYSAFHHIHRGDRIIYIGRPPANTTTYILDAHQCPVPQGATGELYIGGDGVARGYRKRPELSADKFLPDPFRRGDRMYRTGDLARYSRGGVIECLGRTDHQVKIRGFRIELGEIESLLKAQPGVRDAVVIAREDTPGDKRLVAYLIGDVAALDPSTLRAALKVNLPDYMLPAAFVQLDRMPTTPSGKVDRRALPVPSGGVVSTERAIVAPRTYVEEQLAEVWAEVFEIPRVGVDDSFWDLGGHSMLAVRLMSRISQTFGKRIPLNTLFESPTIGQLATHIEDERALGRHSLVPIRPAGSRPPVYWIPGGAALGMFSLKKLLPTFGDDLPLYGLGSAFPSTIEDIERVEERAAQYLTLIRRLQPHGPYYFAGYCAGGIIAYEMAQQLLREDERVAFLGMINCLLPGVPSGRVETIRYKAQRLRYQLGEARKHGGGIVKFFRDRQRALRASRIEQQEISSRVEQAKREGFKDTNKKDYRVVVDATAKVIAQYRARPYPGPVALFVSDDPSLRGVADDLDPRLAWNRVAARSDVYDCEGDHESVIELPYILGLGAALRTAVYAASNEAPPGGSRAAR